jgi:hypothetical protein
MLDLQSGLLAPWLGAVVDPTSNTHRHSVLNLLSLSLVPIPLALHCAPM